jgi:anaphase-promoting complex subunit 3
MEDDGLPVAVAQNAYPPSPPGVHSDTSQPETNARPWTAEDEAAASAEYGAALAEYEVYDLMRQFARAMRALALYDTRGCLNALGELPPLHQRTPWVMSLFGKAHYERTEYSAVRTVLYLSSWFPFAPNFSRSSYLY